MLDSLPVMLAVGTVLGFLSGLGIGGGSLLILWLTVVLGMDQPTARGINLLFFIPSALTACFFRWHQGDLQWRKLLLPIAAGCSAALVCSLLARTLDMDHMRRLLGGLLILTGLRELFYKPKKPPS